MNEPAKPVKQVEGKTLPKNGSRGVMILFAVLIAWGLLIAIGSFQTQASTDYRRPLIVGITMGIFLSVWALALRSRARQS